MNKTLFNHGDKIHYLVSQRNGKNDSVLIQKEGVFLDYMNHLCCRVKTQTGSIIILQNRFVRPIGGTHE